MQYGKCIQGIEEITEYHNISFIDLTVIKFKIR